MARDYSSEYAKRQERAQAAGWDSFYAQRVGRAEARAELGRDATPQEVEDYAEFRRDFAEGEYDRATLHEFFDDYIGGSDEDFYDWLEALYEEQGG